MHVKLPLFSYPSILTCYFGAQKNRLIETDFSSTQNIYFGGEMRKIILQVALLSGGLIYVLCGCFLTYPMYHHG